MVKLSTQKGECSVALDDTRGALSIQRCAILTTDNSSDYALTIDTPTTTQDTGCSKVRCTLRVNGD